MDEPLDWLDSNFNVGYLDALRERIRNLDAIELKNIEPEVQAAIDGVDAALRSATSYDDHYRKKFRRLQALCRETQRRPLSVTLLGDLTLNSLHPFICTNNSDLYKGTYDGQEVAVKFLRIRPERMDKSLKAYYDELILWCYLCRHPNIVPFLGTYTPEVHKMGLVSKWMVNNTISSFLVKQPDANRLNLVNGIVNGLTFLHSLGLVHGDLKAANILVDEHEIPRLGDFGITTMPNSTINLTEATSAGTLRWMSPELFDCEEYEGDGSNSGPGRTTHTPAADIWALAMVIWEIYTGRIPFDHLKSDAQVMFAIVKGRLPGRPANGHGLKLTDGIWEFLLRCWAKDSNSRPVISDAVEVFAPPDLGRDIEAVLALLRDNKLLELELDKRLEIMERLDKFLSTSPMEGRRRWHAFDSLRYVCQNVSSLPRSYHLKDTIALVNDWPVIIDHVCAVYQGVYAGTEQIAIKVLHVHVEDFTRIAQEYRTEAILRRHLRHPNIVPFLGVSDTPTFRIVTKWMPNGTLSEYLRGHPSPNRYRLMQDIVSGLAYLHSVQVIHGDLKSTNILINTSQTACLGISSSAFIEPTSMPFGTHSTRRGQGTMRWMSPELFDEECNGNSVYSDIYALAMVFWHMYSGVLPFSSLKNDMQVGRAIMDDQRPPRPENGAGLGLTDALWETIQRGWGKDPMLRPSLSEILHVVKAEADAL